MKFTDKFLKGIKPKTSAYRIFEKSIDKGFGIKITPAGSISFFIQYASAGSQRFMNLGRYPSVSLSEARDKCRAARAQIDKGVNPQAEPSKAADEPKQGSVANLFDYYINAMRAAGKRSWPYVEADLKHNCGEILQMNAADVRPGHIRIILHGIIERGSETQANRIRSYLHRAFVVGMRHDYDPRSLKNVFTFGIESNPVAAIPRNPAAEKSGARTLTFEEMRVLWNTPDLSPQFRLAARLLLFYGCRTWELLGAEWGDFDFNAMIWTLKPDRTKNERWHLLPITPHAAAWLNELRPYSRDSGYLFPGRHSDDKPIGETSFNHACRRITGIDRFCPRDMRRTTKTRMGEIGIDKSIRDRIQNHAAQDVSAKHYDRYDYMNEKIAALERWGDRLNALLIYELSK